MDDSNQELNQEQGSIDIYIRVKPLTSEERDQKDVNSRLRQYRNSILICKSHKAIYVHMSDKFYRRFVFDRVFSEHSRNKEIFAVCCQKQVDRFLNGFNSSIFVYGQSGTGKTYTMGILDSICQLSDGLIPVSLKYIFERLQNMADNGVSVSMVQVYKDDVYDLLSPKKSPATIREDPETRVFFIPGLVIVPLDGLSQAFELINAGLQSRSMASQNLNETSSRSHLILTVYLKRKVSVSDEVIVSKLTFTDLAGSERVSKSASRGLRLEEARAINSSLSTLAESISHLRTMNDTMLFRKSKLTKILQVPRVLPQSSLMGHSYICILGMVRKSPHFISETVSTLNFILQCKMMKLNEPTQHYYGEIIDNMQEAVLPPLLQQSNESKKIDDSGIQSEFTDFSIFLGKCLISISRMIKKITPQRKPNSRLVTSEEEHGSVLADNKESLVLVEESILEDLAQATSITDALTVFQSSFKILVELLRHLSAQINEQSHEMPASQDTANPDGPWKEELSLILHKLLNQLFVLKIEALTTSQETEDRRLILENFSEVFCKEMLGELAVCLQKVVGKESIDAVFSKLRETVTQLAEKLSQSSGSTNKWKLTKVDKTEKTIATENGPSIGEAKLVLCQKGVQAEISYKNSGQQVDDSITEKKIELLMNANKKLKNECDAYVLEKSKQIQGLNLSKQDLEAEVIRLNGKFSESQNICEELNSRMESKIKECQKMKDLVLEIEAEKEGLKRKIELTMKELVQSVNNEQEYKDQLTCLANEMKSVKENNLKLLNLEKENETVRENNRNVYDEVERMKTNYKQIHEKLKEVIVETSGKIQGLEEALQVKAKELLDEKEVRVKSDARAKELENLMKSRNQRDYVEAQVDKRSEQEILNLREDIQAKVNAAKIMEGELKSKEEALRAMESRWKDKLATELSKAQEEAMEKMSQLKLNFEEQATLLNSKHNGKMEEMRNHFKAEIEKMNGAVRSYEQTHERLKNEISERDSLVKDLKNANNLSLDRCLQAENNLELMRHKMDNKSRDLESVEEWKNRYEAEIKLLKEKLNEGSYRQRDLEREVNGARDGKQVVSLRNEQLEREREGFEARIKELGLEIASLEGEKIKLQGLVQSVNSDHTAFIDQQAADLKLARRELSEKDIETAELKNKLKEASEAHQSTLAAYEERIRCLKESMGNDTDLKKKIDELQKINMEKQTQLMQQKASIEDLFNLNGKLESELNASKSKIQSFAEELKRVKGENANLLESLKTSEELSMRREAELKRVQLEIELLKKAQDEVSRKGMLVSEYQSNLRSLGDELNETQNKLKEVLERNNEKELQVSTLQTKIHDHAMTIKRGNEEYKNLEKEVFELRELKPLKKEIINSSIQQNILREEITSKEKLILVLNGELEGMREGLMKKCKEMEELSVNFKKVIEDVKEKKSEDLKKSTVEFAERLRLKEAELTKAQDEKERMEKEQKQHYEGQIARNEERIAQLMKDSEAKETDILNERNLTIAKLSHELKMKEDELFRVVQDWQEQVNDVKREDQQTLEQCRADLEKIIYEKEEELKKSRREAATLEKDLEREKSSKKSVEGELDGLRKRISELEAKLAENKEKTTQFEKVIRDLLLANQQLSSKLNEHNQLSKQLIKRTQNSIPRTNSNQKSHLPDQSGQPKPNARVSSFDEKNVDNNLLVKFEGQQVVGGVKPDPRNKENQNTINHQSSKVPIEGKVRRESYERVLQERVVPVDPKSRVEGSLRNSGYSNHTQPFASTPSKLISDQQGSVLGLHQVEDLKQYSSRYSRRSPTPHKHQETPLTFNGQSDQVQPFSHL